jgi:diguanylate cyclase (GGDEF)-like protein/PAS domain S-box-containing protein
VKRVRPHILVSCVLAIVLLTGTNWALHNALTDMRFGWFPRQASGDIVLVAIDSPSIDKIGVWPWPRQKHAELIGKLESAGASDIVFDVDFSSPSTPASDLAFADALEQAGGSVVLPAFKQLVGNHGDDTTGQAIHINRPLPQFEQQSWSAIVNVAVEPDGLVRRYSFGELLDGKFLPSVGALLAGKYESNEAPLRIDFSIRPETLTTVSYVDVLRGDAAATQKLWNKKVIIGATAIELGDRFSVPNGRVISGPQLQMLAAESILQGRVLRTASGFLTLGGLAFIALLMLLMWRRQSASIRVVVLVGIAAGAELGAMLLQAKLAVILDTSLWHLAIAAYLAAMALDEIDFRSLLGGVAERRFQRIAMSLGDGLVCADQNSLITVWNPGAVAIFGYEPKEMIGQPLDRVCALGDGARAGVPFSILQLPLDALNVPGGKIMELEGRRKNGAAFPLEACFSVWQGVEGLQYGAVMRDISDRKREAERIKYLAEHDTLTGLANRNTLYEHLAARLAEAGTPGRTVALLMLDLDKFKQINDTLGHACGDRLLCAVATRLVALVDAETLVARLSGDEFAIVIGGADAAGRARALAEQISQAFAKTAFSVGDRLVRVNVSIGVAIHPDHCETADELFGNADVALYRAKTAGRGRHVFFERSFRDELEAQLSLEAELGLAADRKELELFYQPQISLKDGKLAGAETLIRWRHPVRGVVAPAEFMPLVNASSISDRVSLWVMETACRQGRRWQEEGHDIRLGVNLSPSQLQSGDLAATVGTVLKDSGFSPRLLELEVTEDILLEDDEMALETFRRVQALGVSIAFDDFGTGYASLTYLKKFPLDRLKIDKSFVRELRADADDAAIVGCTINLGKLLGLSVIAEGIEDEATAELLKGMGCEEGQGFYYGPPMPVEEFECQFLNGTAAAASAA